MTVYAAADRLRQAAKVLRERAEVAYTTDALTPYSARDYLGGEWGEYIATMRPGVGLALADWLDTAGADLWAHGPLCACGSGCHACDDSMWQPHVRRALTLAGLILGGAS